MDFQIRDGGAEQLTIPKLRLPQRSTVQPASISEQAALLNTLPCTVLQADLAGCLTFLSDNWLQLTGYEARICLGKQFKRYVYSADQYLLDHAFVNHSQTAENTHTLRMLCANGHVKWVQFKTHLAHNAMLGSSIVGTISDITQHVGREASLLANHRSLRELLNDFQ
ncbi:MAG: PAS domain-containing protein, partial [Methylococcales bacterium]|nr:PAS domain-containing protein [Methylococcales bacterium]